MKKLNWPNRLTMLRLLLMLVVVALVLVAYYFNGLQHTNQEIGGNGTIGGQPWFDSVDGPFYKQALNNESTGYSMPILMLVAGIIFIIASATDFLDGFIARKYNQVTDFGKFFDPIADKLLVNATLILFAVTKMLPIWMVVILICRDIFVDFMRMTLARKGTTLAAHIWGKLKTVFQMVGLSLIFFIGYRYFPGKSVGTEALGNEYGYMNQVVMIPMYLATFFSIFSGVDYFIMAFKKGIFNTDAKSKKVQ